MKQIKIFPKTFAYTLGLMLFIVAIAHILLYLFTKPEWLVISVNPHDEFSLYTSLNVADYVTRTVLKALPISLIFKEIYDSYKTYRGSNGTNGTNEKRCCMQCQLKR